MKKILPDTEGEAQKNGLKWLEVATLVIHEAFDLDFGTAFKKSFLIKKIEFCGST